VSQDLLGLNVNSKSSKVTQHSLLSEIRSAQRKGFFRCIYFGFGIDCCWFTYRSSGALLKYKLLTTNITLLRS